ncbi:hypothetical protein [Microbacterium sp. W4I4]|uniref:hypothetical protein n=1 Tax=Microbacterium sp. W4I4 TaxID=3042295 RepID=UPI0027D7A876|nr:hypothetical protein [Microbacterium sp. W4I4]
MAGDSETPASQSGGSIQLAITQTCDAGSDPQCIPVGDEHLMRPSDFEEAAVETAVARNDDEQNAVDVTFTDEGAKVLNDLTTQASDAGTESRLLMKAGDEIVSAVSVMEPISGDQVTLGLSPQDDPDAVVELIQAG